MRTIYDYKDLKQLENSLIYEEIKAGTIITATADLAKEIQSYYPELQVLDVHLIIKLLVEEWDKNVKDIRNYIFLRNIIEDYIESEGLEEEESAYLRRNTADIWNSIVLLEEADVYPDEIGEDTSGQVLHFKRIWRKVEAGNHKIMGFKSAFLYKLSQKEEVEKRVENLNLKNHLLLVGFYYVTPIQQRVIEVLMGIGKNISYLNCYDREYPYAFSIWRKTFVEEYESNSTIDIQPCLMNRNVFGEITEHGRKKVNTEFIKVNFVESEVEFATNCKKAIDRGESLYTTNSKKTEEILKEYFPENYEKKHFLSYPVGQYIYFLHSMWNEFTKRAEMKFEYAYKCFASGWLEVDLLNGKDYLYPLSKLEPFFKQCYSFEEWKKRLSELKMAKEMTRAFEYEGESNVRWHNMLGNPFYNLALYQIDINTIDEIIELFDKLMKDADFLFGKEDRTNLADHLTKIKVIIERQYNREDLSQDELEIAKKLTERLSTIEIGDMECHMNGIKDAIMLLIGSNREESVDEETSDIERMVKPLSMVEASVLSNYGQPIHLVFADEFSLPGNPRNLPWPINEKLVQQIIKNIPQTRAKSKKYVEAMLSLTLNRPLANRYLFFCLMSNYSEENHPVINIEWIEKQNSKQVAASPYVELLGIGYQSMSTDKNKKKMETYKELAKKALEVQQREYCSINMPPENLPEEVYGDFALCPMRYVYGYLLNKYPSFSSEFHYSFVLSKLITAFSHMSGISKVEVEENIFELFPFFRKIELKQASDFANTSSISAPFEFDGYSYPGHRLRVHYLQNAIEDIAEQRAISLFEGKELELQIDESLCMYCPYVDICRTRHIGRY